MRKSFLIGVFAVCIAISGFGLHKFYVSIYRIDYVPQKNRLEITSRIFTDDLNAALKKKFNSKVNIADNSASQHDIQLMNKYLTEKFTIKVNGTPAEMVYVHHEFDSNVIIVYLKVGNVPKPQKLEISNTVLQELFSDQQNIIQVNVPGKKQGLLLTSDNPSGILTW